MNKNEAGRNDGNIDALKKFLLIKSYFYFIISYGYKL